MSFQLGSISTGTLRNEDLLPRFTYALGELAHNPHTNTSVFKSTELAEVWQDGINMIKLIDEGYCADEPNLYGIIDRLCDALNEYAPPYVHFGTNEGDGADFGFWPDIDSLSTDIRYSEYRKLNGHHDEQILLPDEGILVHINDHGNVTVMNMWTHEVYWECV